MYIRSRVQQYPGVLNGERGNDDRVRQQFVTFTGLVIVFDPRGFRYPSGPSAHG